MHHGRLDLEKITVIHKIPDTADNPAPLVKKVSYRRVDDKIEMLVPIPCFNVGQSVPLFRQGVYRFRQKADSFRLDGKLIGLRLEYAAGDKNDIADIKLLKQ
jgi:hypothetical protein